MGLCGLEAKDQMSIWTSFANSWKRENCVAAILSFVVVPGDCWVS